MPKLNFTSVIDKFLEHKRNSGILLGVGAFILLFIGGGLYLLKEDKVTEEHEVMPQSVELSVGQKNGNDEEGHAAIRQKPFLLHPLPDELLQKIASMESFNENAADAKYTGLRVLWPVYYFANQDLGEGKASLLLDVSEDGFGVLIESEVELSAYPAIATLQVGQKMWIGGEILAVDPSGTGTIHLKAEHLHFAEEQPVQKGQTQAN